MQDETCSNPNYLRKNPRINTLEATTYQKKTAYYQNSIVMVTNYKIAAEPMFLFDRRTVKTWND